MYDPKQQSYTKAEFEKLRDEKKPEQRAVICIYCNKAIPYSGDESKDKIYTLMKEHDRICQCNPLVAEIDRLTAELKAKVAEIKKLGKELSSAYEHGYNAGVIAERRRKGMDKC